MTHPKTGIQNISYSRINLRIHTDIPFLQNDKHFPETDAHLNALHFKINSTRQTETRQSNKNGESERQRRT